MTWVVTGPDARLRRVGPAVGKLGDLVGQRRIYLWGLRRRGRHGRPHALAWTAGVAHRCSACSAPSRGPPPVRPRSRSSAGSSPASSGSRRWASGRWSAPAAPVIGVVVGGPLVEAFGWRCDLHRPGAAHPHRPASSPAVVLPETPEQPTGPFDCRRRRADRPRRHARCCSPSTEGPRRAGRARRSCSPASSSPARRSCWLRRGRAAVAQPLLPLRYLRRRNFTFAIATQSFTNVAYMGGFILTPLLLENVIGYRESRRPGC